MLPMTDNIRVNANSKDLIAVAAVWKSPELLRLLLLTAFALLVAAPFVSFFMTNAEKSNVKMREFQALVQKCQASTFNKYGYDLPVTQASAVNLNCKRWANTQVRVYANL
jgi:hypothetical protein